MAVIYGAVDIHTGCSVTSALGDPPGGLIAVSASTAAVSTLQPAKRLIDISLEHDGLDATGTPTPPRTTPSPALSPRSPSTCATPEISADDARDIVILAGRECRGRCGWRAASTGP